MLIVHQSKLLTYRVMGPSHSHLTACRQHLQLLVRQKKHYSTMYLQYSHSLSYVAWSSDASPVVVTPCTEQPGPRVSLPSDPLGLFSLYFDDTLFDLIVEETNKYAELMLQGTGKEWSTDAQEIRAYMGFQILMGINKLPELVHQRVPSLCAHCRPNLSRPLRANHTLHPLC